MKAKQILNEILNNPRWGKNVTRREVIPGREASLEDIPDFIRSDLRRLMEGKGISSLFSHQARAIELAREGRDMVVVTPTASGKTLCYNLPVLNRLLDNPEARALFLFPTKALAQDQVAGLVAWGEELGEKIKTYTYDGDTPGEVRKKLRTAGNIIITNPDMLHTGILPHHTKWMKLFENLEFIVIDELHTYRGVFGSHVANVLRRLARICEFYGSRPQFICTSATIGNPGEHASRLLEREVDVVDQDGSPRGPKEVVFYNPPVVNASLGIRRSSLLEAEGLAAELIETGLQTIIFARSRIHTELLATYLGRRFNKIGKIKIRSYRGGYLPRERRKVEKELRDGELNGVVSTNALELGIDIGTLQAAVLTGYPGTIASTWQQIGRAGRSSDYSLAFIVGTSGPLNQFIINNPSYFLEGSTEEALINPDNLIIAVNHIKCAAFELPFAEGEKFGQLDLEGVLEFLEENQVLRKSNGRYYWMAEGYPAEDISLRSAASDNFVVIDSTAGARVIGEVDRFSAPMLIHEGAIYIHGSSQYHIDRLDYDQEKAYARPVDVDYYTDADLAVDLKVLDVFAEDEQGSIRRAQGDVSVLAKATKYKKIKFYTHENVGWGNINLPEEEMHTSAYWFSVPDGGTDREKMQSALLGIANLLGNVAPLEMMCDPQDLRVLAQVKAPFTNQPTIYVYERYPGGVGFSEKMYDQHSELIKRVENILENCPCSGGCPSCVGPVEEVGEKGKENARWLLRKYLL